MCEAVPSRRKPSAQTGKVLNFEACRRALEEKAAALEEVPVKPEPKQAPVPPRRRWDLALAADLTASVGVLAVLAVVAAQFFLG